MALLPLFPLEVVLLPGTPLPLHIFEPRYKEMIGECLANDAPFGVVRALEEGIAEVGCTAEIITVTKEYPDGRLDLIAEGRKRFEVLELNQDRSFLQAEVLLMPDEPEARPRTQKCGQIQLHLEILSLAGAVQDLSAADQSAAFFLSRRIAATRSRFQAEACWRCDLKLRAIQLRRRILGGHPSQTTAGRANERKGGRQRARALAHECSPGRIRPGLRAKRAMKVFVRCRTWKI